MKKNLIKKIFFIDKRDEKIKDPIFNDQRFEYTPQTQR